MAWEQQSKEIEGIAGDRRHDRRYDIHLELRWKLIRRKRVLETGIGRTLDLSSGGILIEADRPLPVGLNMELSLAWPVMLHNVAPMQLMVSGRIVRATGQRAAIQMVQHEFRTAGVAAEHRNVLSMASRTPVNLLAGANLFFSKAT
jgi:hypothetical protein